MDTASRTTPKADRTRERILGAAGELFTRKGYDACSIRDIAKAADSHSALIYYHFGNKEGLLKALIEDATGKLGDLLESLMVDPDLPTRDKIRSFALHWLEVVVERGDLKAVVLRSMMVAGPVGDLMRDRVLANVRRIGLILEEGKRRGELRADLPKGDLLALQLLQSVIAPVVGLPFPAILALDTPRKMERYVDQSLDIFFLGISARSETESVERRRP